MSPFATAVSGGGGIGGIIVEPPPVDPPPVTFGITDPYSRTLSGMLGQADAPTGAGTGRAYSLEGSFAILPGFSVSGGMAHHQYPALLEPFLQWASRGVLDLTGVSPDYEYRFDFTLGAIPDLLHGWHFLRIGQEESDGYDISFIGLTTSGSSNEVSIFSNSGLTTASVAIATNHMSVHVLAQQVGANAVVKVNVWPFGDPEPAGWLVQRTAAAVIPAELWFEHWQILIDSSTTSYPSEVTWDNLDIEGVPGAPL